MNKTLKIYVLILLGILLFYSDFMRDYIFKNLEYQIHYLSHFTADGLPMVENYTDSWMENFLQGYSISEIVNLKWFFTFIFTVYFFLLSAILPYIIYEKKITLKYASVLYAILFSSVILIYCLRYLSASQGWQGSTYLISLEISHFLQSSLPTIMLILSFKLHLSFKPN